MARCKEVPVAVSEESMRVLYLNYEWDPRESPGALTHIRELSQGLAALGHTVMVEDRRRVLDAASDETHARGLGVVHRSTHLRQRLGWYLHEAAAFCRALR